MNWRKSPYEISLRAAVCIFLILVIPQNAFCTAPPEQWVTTFGGLNDDESYSVDTTSDSGYIIAGRTDSRGAGGFDVWLIKTDSSGIAQGDVTFGGPNNDEGYSVHETHDGGYIIAGSTASYGAGKDDVWLIKTDPSGKELWNKTFGGPNNDEGYSVQETHDGGYIIAGSTLSYSIGTSQAWLIKTDYNGIEQWNRTFGDAGYYDGRSAQETNDGGYVIAGSTNHNTLLLDFWLAKTDSLGAEQWNRTFGGSQNDISYFVRETNDGGYILTGRTESYGANNLNVWLIKADSSGAEQWNRTFGGALFEEGRYVEETGDGGYAITGWTNSYGAGGSDVWLIRTDSYGVEQWNRTIGGPADDVGNSAHQISDGGYILAGFTGSYGAGKDDVWLIKFCPDYEPPISRCCKDSTKAEFEPYVPIRMRWRYMV